MVYASPICTQLRCVRPHALAFSQAATIIPMVKQPSWIQPQVFQATTAACRLRTVCSLRFFWNMAITPSSQANGTFHRQRRAPLAGPYHRWPLGRGFERYYGFLGSKTKQWFPDLTYDNHSVPQPNMPEDGYHQDEDLADHAIQFILDAHINAPDKPFYLYHAPGCAHAPHQVGEEWNAKYRGKFEMGGISTARSFSSVKKNWVFSLRTPSYLHTIPTSRNGIA